MFVGLNGYVVFFSVKIHHIGCYRDKIPYSLHIKTAGAKHFLSCFQLINVRLMIQNYFLLNDL